MNTAIYLINKCPSAALNFKVPDEIQNGVQPDCGHLKVFGCVAYAHKSEGKLEPRARRCMFIGYPTGVKGYKLWYDDVGGSRCIISKDLIYKEDMMYIENSRQSSEQPQDKLAEDKQVEVELNGQQVD